MATVYEGVDRELDKRVAVKVLNPEWRSDPDQVGRFRQEARTAARVRHPHLVDVTDRGVTSDGIPFLVMELLEGKSLQEELANRRQPMPWRRVVGIIVQVCSALEAAHQRGLVHRDIKPANCLLVTRAGQVGDFVKVLDLGIAKVIAGPRDPLAPPSTRTHQGAPGTPEFMAPEQVVSGPTDARSDLYSLGVMMVRMLTGRLPFVAMLGDPAWKVLDMHLTEPPPCVRSMAPEAEIPESIAEIVLRCMAKRLDDRWNSASELAIALRVAEQEEQARLAAASLTGVRTKVYERTETAASLPRTLFRVLMALQSTVLFALSAMSLMLIDLPGVEPLAEWMRMSSDPSERKPRPPIVEPAAVEPVAEPAPESAAVEPVAEPVAKPEPAPPSPAPTVPPPALTEPLGPISAATEPTAAPIASAGVADEPQPEARRPDVADAAGPAPPPVSEEEQPDILLDREPPRLVPARQKVEPKQPDPVAPVGAKKPRPKVEDPFATPEDRPKGVVPGVEVQKAIDKLASKFERCRDMVVGRSASIEVEVELAAGTGKIVAAQVRKGINPGSSRCVQDVLLKASVQKVKLGGKFTAKVQL